MSKKGNIVSDKAQEGLDEEQVIDFFYYDSTRIGSFLGQLDDSGHLKSVVQGDHIVRSRKPGTSLKAGLSLPSLGPGLEGPEAAITFGREAQESAGEANERTYDPVWINALNFKEFLEQKGKIKSDLTSASMGQFVCLTGALSVMDAAGLKVLWQNQDIQKRWVRNAANQKAAESAIGSVDKKSGESAAGNTRLVFDLLAMLPHGIHCQISTPHYQAWGPLHADALISPVGDIALIHGSVVAGEWTMIALLDAHPNTSEEIDEPIQPFAEADAQNIRKVIFGLGNLTRKLLGRPAGVYGVTPLLIYRTITAL